MATQTRTPAAPTADVRTFLEALRALDKGAVLERMTEGLDELVSACIEHGKKGKMQLVLTVDPGGKTAAEHVSFAAEVKVDKPGPTLGKSLFYVDDEGRLSRRDPRQADLEDLTPGPRPVKPA